MTGVNWSLDVNALVIINFETNVFKEMHCNCKTTCMVTLEYVTAVPACPSYIFLFFNEELLY